MWFYQIVSYIFLPLSVSNERNVTSEPARVYCASFGHSVTIYMMKNMTDVILAIINISSISYLSNDRKSIV